MSLSNLAIEMNSLAGKIHVAQWNNELSIERKQFLQAKKYIKQHFLMAKESDSNPSLNSNLILQLKLALASDDNPEALQIIEQLQQITKNNLLQSKFSPLFAEYLSKNHLQSKAIAFLEQQLQEAIKEKDSVFAQQLSILLAKEHLNNNLKSTTKCNPEQLINIKARLQETVLNENSIINFD